MDAKQFMEKLKVMTAFGVCSDPEVKENFISIYNTAWKNNDGAAVYEREVMYLQAILRDKKDLTECTGASVYYSFIELASLGLTLKPGAQALCYLQARSMQVNNAWVKICKLSISGYGELAMRIRQGQIRHADNPVIVYEGDEFQFGERDGHKVVNYMAAFPRKSNKIVACYIKITKADGSYDYSVMLEQDWKRLKGYSEKQNKNSGGGANPLYSNENGGIDSGFLIAKCIKHAFKPYPKLLIGNAAVLESDEDYEQQPQQPIVSEDAGIEAPQPETFADPADLSGGVIVSTNDEVF